MSEETKNNDTNGKPETSGKKSQKSVKKEQRKKRSLFHKIINIFLHIAIVLFVILLLFFGFTQTSTFREWLRETIIEEANASLNGTVNIEAINGTIFTSLIIKGTSLSYQKDTIAHFRELELYISPHFLFIKEIHVRKLQIDGGDITLETDAEGVLNLTRVFPPSDRQVQDTTESSPFPFDIDVEELELMNVSFSHQDYAYIGSSASYTELNTSDIRIKNFYLDCNADISPGAKSYALDIAELYFESNLEPLSHVTFEGEFLFDTTGAAANNVNLLSNNTDIFFDAYASNINLFGSPGSEELGDMEVFLDLDAERFSFGDLSAIVPSVSMLKGELVTEMRASGTLRNLNIAALNINYLSTELRLQGSITNLNDTDELTINTVITGSKLHQPDIAALMPELELPEYEKLATIRIDTLSYSGRLDDFRSRLILGFGEKGMLRGDISFNMRPENTEYSIFLQSSNLQLAPLTGMNTLMNIDSLTARGRGFTPADMRTSVYLSANKSVIGNTTFNRLFLSMRANGGIVKIDTLFGVAAEQRVGLMAKIDLTNEQQPHYNFVLESSRLNMGSVLSQGDMNTGLNLRLEGKGKHFDPDKIAAELRLQVDSSTYQYQPIEPFQVKLSVQNPGAKRKSIILKSDIVDVELSGHFEFANFTGVVAEELQYISGSIVEKVNSYFPFQEDTVTAGETLLPQSLSEVKKQREEKRPFVDCGFKINFNDVALLTPLLKSELFIGGEFTGSIKNDDDGFLFEFLTDSIDAAYGSGDEKMSLSNGYVDMKVSHGFPVYSINDIRTDINIKAGMVSLGDTDSSTYFKYIGFNGLLNESHFEVGASAAMNDEIRTGFSFSSDFTADTLTMKYDSLSLSYRKFDLVSRESFTISFHEEGLTIKDFNLFHNDVSGIFVDGSLSQEGDQNIHIDIKNFHTRDLSQNFLDDPGAGLPESFINMQADLTGNFANPDMYLQISADSLAYNGRDLGTFYTLLEYDDEVLTVDAKFLASMEEFKNPKLYIYGTIPVNMALVGDVERISETEPFDLHFNTDSLELNIGSNIFPGIKRFEGDIFSSLRVSGTYPDLVTNGDFTLSSGVLVPAANNLRYLLNLSFTSEKSLITFDTLSIENAGDSEKRGRLSGGGTIAFDGFDLQSANMNLGGDLTLLSDASKGGNLGVHGNLYIVTDGDITFETNNEVTNLNANIILRESDVIYEMKHSAYSRSAENFVYIYGSLDSLETITDTLEQDSEIASGGQMLGVTGNNKNFNYDISLVIEDDAYATFIFSPEANQSLTAQLEGKLHYSMQEGERDFSGELRLLENSKLDLMNLKTFNATGTVRFDNDLANPYLDISAVYRSYYTFSDEYGGEREREVAVKINLKGNMDYVTKNFSQIEDNIAIYIGSDNIEEDVRAGGYDKADAVWFVLTGKLPQDLTQEDRRTAANEAGFLESSATSIAGSLVGGLLNAYLGDFVESFDVRQGAKGARFNISGKVEGVRYSIGGTSEIFDNISEANIRIEYPIFFDKNLLIRLERKQDYGFRELDYSSYEMVNEIGLKYRIGF